MFVRADVDLSDCATSACEGCDVLGRYAVYKHDASLDIYAFEILLGAFSHIDDLCRYAFRRRRDRHGMGDAADRVAVDIDGCLARQADIGVVKEKLCPIAVRDHLRFQITKTLQLFRRARKLHPLGELADVPHQELPIGRARSVRHHASPGCQAGRRPGSD